MQLEIEGQKRNVAYFIPVDGKTDRGWNVAIAAEGVPGFFPTDWFWSGSFEDATQLVVLSNAKRGISEEEAERIVGSSVAASRKEVAHVH
jgi:hypothetical protein